MKKSNSVNCEIQGSRSSFKKQIISFELGSDLSYHIDGKIGPFGISDTCLDLIDIAASIYQIERQLSGFTGTNAPRSFKLGINLRNPNVWREESIQYLEEILELLGNASWKIEIHGGLKLKPQKFEYDSTPIKKVVLLSGGLDSTCGLATLKGEEQTTRIVSFYTRQKTLQQNIASELNFSTPVQFSLKWSKKIGRKHSFFYRSFLFLCIANSIACSWDAKDIFQYENGILASSIPPSNAWMMTKHSHPLFHDYVNKLLNSLSNNGATISNPFLLLTKKEIVNNSYRMRKNIKKSGLLEKTESCWYYWSNRIIGGGKKPGMHCGVCIPCLVRRTAQLNDRYHYDLSKDSNRNDLKRGIGFRSYYGFLNEIDKTSRSPSDFYSLLPASGKMLINRNYISLNELHKLFLKFSKEFTSSFKL